MAKPDDDRISELFEEAVAQREKSPYYAGVANALGWVLGEYEDEPIDEQ